MPAPTELSLIAQNWKVFCDFMDTLQWQVGEGKTVSYAELAVAFHVRHFVFPSLDSESATLREVISILRKLCTTATAGQCDNASFHPGSQSSLNKSCGRTFPAGVILGASCWLSNQELCVLADLCSDGASQCMKSWNFLLQDVFVSN